MAGTEGSVMAWTAGPVAGVVAAPGLPDSLGLAAPGTGTMVAGTGATGMGDPRTQETGTRAPGTLGTGAVVSKVNTFVTQVEVLILEFKNTLVKVEVST